MMMIRDGEELNDLEIWDDAGYSPWYGALSIGIETEDGKMTRVIPRNPTLPTKKTHVLTTFWDKRSTVTIKVFEGERSETKDCRFLGQLQLSGIPAARYTVSAYAYG
jgi:molecular chaperone DnaK (HSP70)